MTIKLSNYDFEVILLCSGYAYTPEIAHKEFAMNWI